MDKLVKVLAFLGAVLVGFVAQLIAPDTPLGRTVAFAAFGVAMYPLARVSWPTLSSWRYWTGLAVASTIGWRLDVWRADISDSTNRFIGLAVLGFATVCLLFAARKAAYRKI